MFSDYKVQVVDFYKRNRVLGKLPLNLINPTPAKLKKECLLVFQSRNTKGDLAIIRQFFGHRDDEDGYLKAIKNIDTDKFKPLVNFLKEQTQDTEDKNIELLAWLVNYNPRPFQFNLYEKKPSMEETINDLIKKKQEPIINLGNKVNLQLRSKIRNRDLIIALFLLITIISILLFSPYLFKKSLAGLEENKKQCMYWSNDQFVLINCDEKIPNTQILSLDESKIKYFKKITRPDTLTIADINRVWYSKINKVIELYSSPGYHPIHTEKQLKPLSMYMFNKYIMNEENRKLINTN